MNTDQLRVGDAERDAVTSALHEHFAQGRLTREELDERLSATLAAKTVGDLREVTRDLPADPAAPLLVRGTGGRLPVPPWTGGAPYWGGPLWGGPLWTGSYRGRPPWVWHPGARRMAYRGRHPRFGPPAGVFLLAFFLVVAFTGGWFVFPVFAAFWFTMAFVGIRHARRWHRPTG